MNLRGGFALIKKSLFSYTASKGFFWTLTFSWMISPLIYMFVWTMAVGNGNIAGFQKNDIMIYYICFIVINQLTYPSSHWTVGDNIFNGTFSTWLLRPLPPIFEAIAGDIALKVICVPFITIFTFLLCIVLNINLQLDWTFIVPFLIALFLAQILRFILGYVIALMALFTSKISSLLSINDTLLLLFAGQIVPISLLPDVLQRIADVLPYRYMLGFPVEIILGKLTAAEIQKGIGLQVIFIAVIVVLERIVWKTGIKHYGAVGA